MYNKLNIIHTQNDKTVIYFRQTRRWCNDGVSKEDHEPQGIDGDGIAGIIPDAGIRHAGPDVRVAVESGKPDKSAPVRYGRTGRMAAEGLQDAGAGAENKNYSSIERRGK